MYYAMTEVESMVRDGPYSKEDTETLLKAAEELRGWLEDGKCDVSELEEKEKDFVNVLSTIAMTYYAAGMMHTTSGRDGFEDAGPTIEEA